MILDLTDALIASINGHAFDTDVEFTAVRMYSPEHGLKELRTLRVIVVPQSEAVKVLTRESDQCDYQVDVAVQKKLETTGEDELDECDDVMDLVDQIKRFLNRLRPETAPDARVMGIKNEPIFAPEHLDKFRVFTSLITVTIREERMA